MFKTYILYSIKVKFTLIKGYLFMSISLKYFAKSKEKSTFQKGFTLIEVMVVIAIIGILAALIAPKIMSRSDQARKIAARQDIGTIMQALKLYRLDNGIYPTQEQGLDALIIKPEIKPIPYNWKDGGYLERLVNDPWGNKYQYLNPGLHGDIDVFSFGSKGLSSNLDGYPEIGSWS